MTKLVNRAKMTTATTGTGTITLGSAVDGYQSFASAGVVNSDVVRYAIEDDLGAWELGTGTYTSTGTTLSRTLLESSTGSLLNLTGNAVVYVIAAAEDVQQPPAEGAFVDGDKTKLDGIEAGADVTDTANVTAAGALMDSEVTNLAAVKAFDPADYATAAQGALADSATQPGDNISTLTNDSGFTTNTGTVTSVAATVPAGFTVSGSPVTTSGTIAVSYDTGYQGFTTAEAALVASATQPGDNVSTLTNDAGYTTNTGTVTSVAATAGTGISITGSPITSSGTLTITNTAPDQTVSLTGGGATSISGTYPNFTISSTDTNTTYSPGTALDLSGTTFNVDLSELATSTTDGDGDYFVVVDTLNAQRKLTKGNINISGFNNDAGYTTNVGDITGVTAGSGLTGGGTSGTVTVSHADTSSQGSVNNSGATVIQDVTLDTYGHVTGLASKTLTAADVGAITGNQTITLSGDLSGSGTTSINAQIVANAVGANELNVTGNGTTAQYLRSDGDGTFTWDTPASGASTTFNDVGTYAHAGFFTSSWSAVSAGSTVSGGSLRTMGYKQNTSGGPLYPMGSFVTALSGTWRCMGNVNSHASGGFNAQSGTLWVRIS